MAGVHAIRGLLALENRGEALGLNAVWIGDWLLAKPLYEPLSFPGTLGGSI